MQLFAPPYYWKEKIQVFLLRKGSFSLKNTGLNPSRPKYPRCHNQKELDRPKFQKYFLQLNFSPLKGPFSEIEPYLMKASTQNYPKKTKNILI